MSDYIQKERGMSHSRNMEKKLKRGARVAKWTSCLNT